MSETKRNSGKYKKALLVVPLLFLFLAIAFNQNYLAANDPPAAQDLQLVGFVNGLNYESGIPLTLSNVGNNQVTIRNVTYDGHPLTQGRIGGTFPMFAPIQNDSSLCLVSTYDLVFPQSNHWDMDTGGLCTTSIPPGGVATIYLGVFSDTNSSHIVTIATQEGSYSFII